ncbi:hypothetical protein [Bacillus licheniformis]|nr:hypothetical protein [Bacillus licheniformis]
MKRLLTIKRLLKACMIINNMTQYDAENGDRGANRNSKHGKQGESHQ